MCNLLKLHFYCILLSLYFNFFDFYRNLLVVFDQVVQARKPDQACKVKFSVTWRHREFCSICVLLLKGLFYKVHPNFSSLGDTVH